MTIRQTMTTITTMRQNMTTTRQNMTTITTIRQNMTTTRQYNDNDYDDKTKYDNDQTKFDNNNDDMTKYDNNSDDKTKYEKRWVGLNDMTIIWMYNAYIQTVFGTENTSNRHACIMFATEYLYCSNVDIGRVYHSRVFSGELMLCHISPR